jgi:hypothetical protein
MIEKGLGHQRRTEFWSTMASVTEPEEKSMLR